jgi:copper homeostasis protein
LSADSVHTEGALLEVCVDSLRSAIAAEKGGARRIELCSALEAGGITPSHGLVAEVCSRLRIPVHVLIRPRAGDFRYSPGELRVMERDILAARKLGASGIVVGALRPGGTVDAAALRALLRAARPMSVTFHRAFDSVPRPLEALVLLSRLGVDRILTSGGGETALAGRSMIRRLSLAASDGLSIIAGGGIGPRAAVTILRETAVREIHVGSAVAAFRRSGRGAFAARNGTVDENKVRSLVRLMEGIP